MTAKRKGYSPVWSPARDAEATRLWAETTMAPDDMVPLLNAIDSDTHKPIARGNAVQERMTTRHVRRHPDVAVLAKRTLIEANAKATQASLAKQARVVELTLAGMSVPAIAIELGVVETTVYKMRLRAGIKGHSNAPGRPAGSRNRTPPPPKAPKPQRRPVLTIRAQTVDEWLQAGGAVTRCPAAVTAPTTARLSDADREALREHQARLTELAQRMPAKRRWHSAAGGW